MNISGLKLPALRSSVLLFLSLVIILGAGVYYFYALNWPGIILTVVLGIVAFTLLQRRFQEDEAMTAEPAPAISGKAIYASALLVGAYAASVLAALTVLVASRNDRALITPWAVVPASFFWLYAAASLWLVLILINRHLRSGLKVSLLSVHYLLSFAVAAVVYKIGYGYDPFVHEAAMELIAAKGLVLPKAPYYLGEYSLVVILHKISGLAIPFLSKILVPGLAALFLPAALYRFLKMEMPEKNFAGTIFLTILFMLGLTFSPLILTTPQNLSYLFLILTVLAGFRAGSILPAWILALATAAIHPLTGLPALAWAAAVSLQHHEKIAAKTRLTMRAVIFLFASLALPLALFFAAGDGNSFGDAGKLWASLTSWLAGAGTAGREDWLSNAIYFFANNYPWLAVLAAAGSLWHVFRQKNDEYAAGRKDIVTLILPALLVAYLLSGQINFSALIHYEQADYADRLPVIMLIFLLPFFLSAGRDLIGRIRRADKTVRIIWLIGGLGLLTAALYISYPRFDKYWNSHGYSTSQNDLVAVESVATDSPSPYIALANQQVSAAALQEFGFDHYHETPLGPMYFYPIPTGGPLYQYYLDMVYGSPDQKTMAAAMALAGVERGYLIVNKYWHRSDRIIAAAKLAAEKWWTIGDEVYIFRYSR